MPAPIYAGLVSVGRSLATKQGRQKIANTINKGAKLATNVGNFLSGKTKLTADASGSGKISLGSMENNQRTGKTSSVNSSQSAGKKGGNSGDNIPQWVYYVAGGTLLLLMLK